jgi:predicted transport protein
VPTFSILGKTKLSEVAEVSITAGKEKEIQNLVENNLDTIFGIQLVKSEYTLRALRMDTLGFDPKSKSFVVIEYKRKETLSVSDQGFTYSKLIKENREACVLLYRDKFKSTLKVDEVDWGQTKIIFITPSFNSFQRQLLDSDYPVELWQVKRFANDTIVFTQIGDDEEKTEQPAASSRSRKTSAGETKTVSEETHLGTADEERKALYKELKTAVLAIGSATFKTKIKYLAFVRKTNFLDVVIYKSQLNLFLNMAKGTLKDSRGLAEDVSNKGHWGNGDYVVKLRSKSDLEYVLHLIRQSYDVN